MRALAISVLVGVQPVLTHVPPKRWRSMIATDLPAPAKRAAKEGPAWPAPITMASYLRFIEVLQGRGRSRRLDHCAQLDVRRYALRRPAACQEYCAAGLRGLKTGRWQLIDSTLIPFYALSFKPTGFWTITLLPPRGSR